MKLDVWRCDVCDLEFRDGGGKSGIAFYVDNESDPVDSHNVRVYKHADMCSQCQADFIDELLELLPISKRAELAKNWGAK